MKPSWEYSFKHWLGLFPFNILFPNEDANPAIIDVRCELWEYVHSRVGQFFNPAWSRGALNQDTYRRSRIFC